MIRVIALVNRYPLAAMLAFAFVVDLTVALIERNERRIHDRETIAATLEQLGDNVGLQARMQYAMDGEHDLGHREVPEDA
jgi:hypothetical protein